MAWTSIHLQTDTQTNKDMPYTCSNKEAYDEMTFELGKGRRK